MITRPLDLLSKLRPPPRNYDFLFLVNGGLIALLFSLFGSRFVLSPGLRVDNDDVQLRSSPYAIQEARETRVSIGVNASGQILGDTGLINRAQLKDKLAEQAKRAPGSYLLVIGDERAPLDVYAVIRDTAIAVGFAGVHIAALPAPASEGNVEVQFPK